MIRVWTAIRRMFVPRPKGVVRVTLYTRSECHLCHDAARLLDELKSKVPLIVDSVDIDGNEELTEKFGDKVPVIAIAGKVRMWGRINPTWLARTIQGERQRQLTKPYRRHRAADQTGPEP